MAEELKCKCGAGPFAETKDLRVHILNSARRDGKGTHGWASTKEVPNPVEITEVVTFRAPLAPGLAVRVEAPPRDEDDLPTDLALELDEMRYLLRVMRSEFDALKEKVNTPSATWADAVKPVPIDQEAVNLAQLNAMMGIDQPGPLDRKEQEIIAAVTERVDQTPGALVGPEAPPTDTLKGGVPRGVFLILAFVAVVGVVVLVITQT